MIKNYLKIAWRNIIKNKVYSFLNIAGLSIGLTSFILILLWTQDELSYDRFHENSERLYRVVERQYDANNEPISVATTPAPLAPYLKNTVPGINSTARLVFTDAFDVLFRYNGQVYNEFGLMTDPSFFEMFSFKLLKGNPQNVLSGLHNIVISEKLARKYFGTSEPIGEIFEINKQNFTVTGVLQDLSKNTHLKNFDFVISFELLKTFRWDNLEYWERNSYYTYALLSEHISASQVNDLIANAINKNYKEANTEVYLQPVTRIHLYSNFISDLNGHGDIQKIYIFSTVALFVLLIACINFMNLSTARSARRSKEVSMRKVFGARRRQLVWQFLSESVLVTFFGLIISIALVQLLLPYFNTISGKTLHLNLLSESLLPIILLTTILTGLIAGSYPALVLSSFSPFKILKQTLKTNFSNTFFRKVLVVFQFSLSILLISCTLIIYNQLSFIQNKKLGVETKQVISFPMRGAIRKQFESFKNELKSSGSAADVSAANYNLTDVGSSNNNMDWDGKNPNHDLIISQLSVDPDFVKLFKIKITEGRNFSKHISSDSLAVILNEEATRQMGIKDAINKTFLMDNKKYTIVGIAEDFHFKPLHEKIEPLVLFINPGWYRRVFVRLNNANIQNNLASVESIFKKFNPGYSFEYSFLEEDFGKLYRTEQRTGTIFNYFSLILIFISCLGLYGLSAFSAEQRKKEIGIRKVLGASVSSLATLLSRDFIRLVIIAAFIAVPVAWFIMNNWLKDFAYRVNIEWWIFAIAGVAALLIALITVSVQTIRSAFANPVKSLRSE